jgi:hypothetical protein
MISENEVGILPVLVEAAQRILDPKKERCLIIDDTMLQSS